MLGFKRKASNLQKNISCSLEVLFLLVQKPLTVQTRRWKHIYQISRAWHDGSSPVSPKHAPARLLATTTDTVRVEQ